MSEISEPEIIASEIAEIESESSAPKGKRRLRGRMIPKLFENVPLSIIRLFLVGSGISIFTLFTVNSALLHEMAGIFTVRPFEVFLLLATVSFFLVSAILLYPILALHYRQRILVEEEVKKLNMKYHEGLQEFQERTELDDGPAEWIRTIDYLSKDYPDYAYLHKTLLQYLNQKGEEIREKMRQGKQTFEQIKKDYIRSLINATAKEILEDTTYNLSSYEMPVSFCMLAVAFGFVVSSLIPFSGTGKIQVGDVPINLIWATGGFMGAYLYSLYPFFQRYTRRDLPPRAFLYYALKVFLGTIAVTILGNLFLETFAEAHQFSAAAILGSMPFLIMTQARKRAFPKLRRNTSKTEGGDQDVSVISGITYEYAERLHEEGIMNVQNLVFIDTEIMSKRTMFNQNMLFDWKDEAILRLLTGKVPVEHFFSGEDGGVSTRNLYKTLVDVGINNVTNLATRLECRRSTIDELKETGEEYTIHNTKGVTNLIKLLGWKDEEEYRYFLIKICIQGKQMLGEISKPTITASAFTR